MQTSGVDRWGAARTVWKMTGGSYQNSGAISFGSGMKGFFQGSLSGESIVHGKGPFQLAEGSGSIGVLTQSGGKILADKGFSIVTGAKAKGSYRISGGELVAETITLGAVGNGLAELQTLGTDPTIKIKTITCRGTVALGFVTGLNTLAPLAVPAYLDLRGAEKAVLKVDLRTNHKEGTLTLITCPRINGKFTHVEVSAKGKAMDAVTTENLGFGNYSLAYTGTGLDISYRLPKR
jgi:hypothetical protein